MADVKFAGVPLFDAPLDGNKASAPLQPGQTTTVVPDPAASKLIPGQPSSSDNDPTKDPSVLPKKGESPLDGYANLFDNSPKLDAEGKPIELVKPVATILDATLTDFSKAAEKIDFTAGITPEQVAEVQTEDGKLNPEGLLKLIQSVGQASYSQALTAATKITSEGVKIAGNKANDATTQFMIMSEVSNLVVAKNPNLGHPAFIQTAKAIQTLAIKKNPDKTPEQISKIVVDYFKQAGNPDSNSGESTKDEDNDPFGLGALFDLK